MSHISTFDPVEAQVSAIWSNDKGSYLLPYLIATFFDCLLLGVIICMATRWYTHRDEERKLVVICVYIAMISSIACSVYLMVWVTQVFVWHFGIYKEFAKVKWIAQYSVIGDMTSTAVQICYADRAYRINKHRKWIPISVILLIIITKGMHLTSVIHSNIKYEFASPAVSNDPLDKTGVYVWVAGGVLIDILITACIANGLCNHKTGWKKTDNAVQRLIFVTLETQVPALISAILVLVAFGRKMIVLLFIIPQPKVYTVGLLALLNSRFSQREESRASDLHGVQVYPQDRSSTSRNIPVDVEACKTEVRVDVETYVVSSLDSLSVSSVHDTRELSESKRTSYIPSSIEAGK